MKGGGGLERLGAMRRRIMWMHVHWIGEHAQSNKQHT